MRPATFGVILLLMLSVSMCMGRDKKTFKDQMNVRNEKFPNHENENHNPGFAYGGRSVNNHHYIPRQDFNNNDGADKIGNGSGY
ncbi:hypothetical protein AAZX31_12G165400 [Glycine max]|uniref:Uncharacterized protein n=3 Tax=Glycine subgen. Soja TaxID=1462606 RepID=K7LVK0_SOYBN|nr:hypothetical protein JHK85_034933 [Glycine max]KHN06862.1 hypothetical protein glysoja_037606 [Glycine soja]KAG4986599.1 hypothetical protein JHK86_034290 [Glycine max]KAG5119801.1 hypothetical protein JHK82_034221 [Glycine max]KAG5140791.1 hypothetical protein JHK84_034559 [Glycine max]